MVAITFRGLRHTRWVPSGSPPLYRLILVGVIISGLVQAITGKAPKAVSENSFSWFDYVFTTSQLAAGIVCVVSLYMIDGARYSAKRLHLSLSLEMLGLIGLQTTTAVSVVANGYFNDGIPPGMGTWVTIMFWCWVWARMWEIRKTTRELTR